MAIQPRLSVLMVVSFAAWFSTALDFEEVLSGVCGGSVARHGR